jgi:hypothetical protein
VFSAVSGSFTRTHLRRFLLILVAVILTQSIQAQDASPQPRVVLGGNPNGTLSGTPASASQLLPNAGAAAPTAISPNALILDTVESMPGAGGYRANLVAMSALHRSIQMVNSQLSINPSQATPSFCSGATYLVFVSVLERLCREGRIALDEETLRGLLVQEHQPDGVGAWGRWNANGPGTARFFYETGLGRNFTSFADARAGDFMKIFWNDEIGARESGHSVIFLESISKPEGEFVRYWSSNQPNGFGTAVVSRQRIKRVLFSRLEHPEQIRNILAIPARDAYLAAMLKRPSSGEEMARMVGMSEGQSPKMAMGPSISPLAPTVSASPATPPPAKESVLKRLFHW